MTSRPATPESDMPRTGRAAIYERAFQLERRLAQAQADLAAHKIVIGLLFESLPDCPFMGDLPGCVDEMKARIAELEKALEMVKTQIVNLPRSSTADSIHRAVEEALKDRT